MQQSDGDHIKIFDHLILDHYDQSDCISEKTSGDEDMTRPDACPPGAVSLKDFVVGFPTQSGKLLRFLCGLLLAHHSLASGFFESSHVVTWTSSTNYNF